MTRRFADNAGRVARVVELDAAIEAWTQSRTVADVLKVLAKQRSQPAACTPPRTSPKTRTIVQRDMILKQVTRDGHEIEVPGIVPKLSATPGSVRSSAPRLGDDTDAVLAELGLAAEAIAALRARNVVAYHHIASRLACCGRAQARAWRRTPSRARACITSDRRYGYFSRHEERSK